MAKFKFKLKKSWKSLVSVTLAGVALFGAIFGLVTLSKKISADTKEIHPTFNVGAIDNQGNYMDSETSIYTKNLFECQGLSIEPDFEAIGTFSVYYYAQDKTFMGSTGNIKASDGVYSKKDSFSFAQYARIVISPAEDDQIRFYEVSGYADDYTITVNKDQKPNYENLENFIGFFGIEENVIQVVDAENHPVPSDCPGMSTVCIFDAVVGSKKIGLVFDTVPLECTYIVVTEHNTVIDAGTLDVSSGVCIFNLPELGSILMLNFNSDCIPAVYNAG